MEKNEENFGFGKELGADYEVAQSFRANGDYYLTKVTLLVFDSMDDDFIEVEIWHNDLGGKTE